MLEGPTFIVIPSGAHAAFGLRQWLPPPVREAYPAAAYDGNPELPHRRGAGTSGEGVEVVAAILAGPLPAGRALRLADVDEGARHGRSRVHRSGIGAIFPQSWSLCW